MNERLKQILLTMDLPENRRFDLFWLSRNMSIRNKDHVNFEEAWRLLQQEIRTEQDQDHITIKNISE